MMNQFRQTLIRTEYTAFYIKTTTVTTNNNNNNSNHDYNIGLQQTAIFIVDLSIDYLF